MINNAVNGYCKFGIQYYFLSNLIFNDKLNIFLITQEYLELKLLPERLSMIYHNIVELEALKNSHLYELFKS